MDKYQAKGTIMTCPYSGEITIISSFGDDVDRSQCVRSKECTIEHCPLEQELKRY